MQPLTVSTQTKFAQHLCNLKEFNQQLKILKKDAIKKWCCNSDIKTRKQCVSKSAALTENEPNFLLIKGFDNGESAPIFCH